MPRASVCHPLLGSVVDGAVGPELLFDIVWVVRNLLSSVGNETPFPSFPTFYDVKFISTYKNLFHSVSPFLVEKALTVSVRDLKSVKKTQCR
ncbi:hypothetical protein AVEN_275764-1 [Araneus ventricosus]|uniref:Uncharacterized protein n=1 Tax=Araneus ventricosus TaxID=182803 RepID=A0A4Y2VVS0_ARAVE|nr:hypothetical protein AVEN_275764-1 [Araneus ventricosus]